MTSILVSNSNFFDNNTYQALLARLESIKPNSERKWGSMNTAQMLHHLNLGIGSGIGFYTLSDNSSWFSRSMNKFLILNVLKRFPKGIPTAKSLRVMHDYDFETEKKQLKAILSGAFHTKSDEDWGKHTYFGRMTREAWGKLIVIHCNHHFQQFSS